MHCCIPTSVYGDIFQISDTASFKNLILAILILAFIAPVNDMKC